jgi:hypothetical protein
MGPMKSSRVAASLVLFFLGAGCASSAPGHHGSPQPGEDADVAEPPTPDAGSSTPDGRGPAPEAAPPLDPDAAPAIEVDAGRADLPPPASDGGGGTFAVGERVSLRDALSALWTKTRESTKQEDGVMVFTGVFEANKIGGPQGHTPRLVLKPGREYLFEYRVRFDGDFPFTRGGKLPGLAGGNAPTGCVDTDANGFSARMMWRQAGALIGYLYDQDQGGNCGNNITTSVNFKAGQWYALKERIRLNTGRNHDGVLQVWADDKLVIDRKNMEYMAEAPNNRIGVVLFHSFFGGSTQDWAPARQCSISFAEPFATLLAE